MKLNNLLSTTFLVSAMALGTASANGMMKVDCCDKVADLESRVDRLDAKAVEGTTKKIRLSGWVSRAVMWHHNGVNSNTTHVSNGNMTPRITLDGTAAYNDDTKFGAKVTVEYRPNAGYFNDVRQAQNTLDAGDQIRLREVDAYIMSKTFGTLTLGHGNMASRSVIYNADFGGAYDGILAVFNSAVNLVVKNGGPNDLAGLSVGGILEVNDSISGSARHDRIRYDTPSFYGLSFSAGHAFVNTGDMVDAAARFGGNFGGWGVILNAGVGRNQAGQSDAGGQNVNFDYFTAAGAVQAPFSMSGMKGMGPHLHVSFSTRDFKNTASENSKSYYFKLGHKDMYTKLGATNIEVMYGDQTNSRLLANPAFTVKGKTWGVSLDQKIDKVATSVYAAYHNMSGKVKNRATRYHDVHQVLAGVRVNF